jgi:glucosyl-dolichyl phosphate glucuronosyltransferase
VNDAPSNPTDRIDGRPQTDISVVICAYADDRWPDLLAAVASVQAQVVPAREIIVVVDHNERLLDRVRTEISGIAAVANVEARGLSGARNSGVAAAASAIVAFLDDDATAAPDWLEQLAAAYDDPWVLGVGGAVEPAWAGGRPGWFPHEFDWVVGCTYRGMPKQTASVRNLIGANMSFRRCVLETIGGFRSGIGRIGALPVGCEETELCIRGRQRWPDGIWRFEPRARVVHTVPAHRARWEYFRSRCYAEGRSKALVARLVGAGDGLSSERSYTRRTLTTGIGRSLAAATRGDLAGPARAAAIVGGFAVTASGYLTGAAAAFVGRPALTAAVARRSRRTNRPWRAAPRGG